MGRVILNLSLERDTMSREKSSRPNKLKTFLSPKPKICSAVDEEKQPDLERLDSRLCEFYNSDYAPRSYESAEKRNDVWTADMKGHMHLRNAIPVGSSVIDLGCGSIHSCRNLAEREVDYTGVDWSEEQIALNRELMPDHTFLASSLYRVPLPEETFDVAISLYVIEHVVWPHRFLDEIYRLVRPGGLRGILCPPFRIRNTIKSFEFGLSPRPFSEKLKLGHFVDATVHLYQHRVSYPHYLEKHFHDGSDEEQFLINLEPVCLEKKEWFPDADAVYLTDTKEIVSHLASKGSELIEEWPDHAYVLMRKRG